MIHRVRSFAAATFVLAALIWAAVGPVPVSAQTADDVNCPVTHCVGAADLASGNLDNAAEDGNFERSQILAGGRSQSWPTQTGAPAWTIVQDRSNCANGSRCVRRAGSGTASDAALQNAALVDVHAGETFVAEAWLRGDSGTNGTAGVRITFYDATGAVVATPQTLAAAAGRYTNRLVQAAAPSNAAAASVAVVVAGHSAGTWFADVVAFRRQLSSEFLGDRAVGVSKLDTTSVDTRYPTRSDLSTNGTLNATSNPVAWTKLKGVPSGFSDGIDDGIESPGFGMTLTKPYGIPTWNVDPTKVQRRVTGTCPAGTDVRGVAQDGTVTCAVGTSVFYAYRNTERQVCDNGCVEATLDVPAGTYAVSAKEVFYPTDLNNHSSAACTLTAEGDTDKGVDSNGSSAPTTLNLQLVHTFANAGSISLSCNDTKGADSWGGDLKITALAVGAQNRTALP